MTITNTLQQILEYVRRIDRNTRPDDEDGEESDEPEEPPEPDTHDIAIAIKNEDGDAIRSFEIDAIPDEEHPEVQKRFGQGGWRTDTGYENVVYEGEYDIEVTADGYERKTKTVTIDSDTDVEIVLTAIEPDSHDLAVEITDEHGHHLRDFEIGGVPPQSHPLVQLRFGQGGWRTETGYENVVYQSEYEITVTADGYEPEAKEVRIAEDTSIEMVLEFEDPKPSYTERTTERIEFEEGDTNAMKPGKDLEELTGESVDEAHMRYEVYFPVGFEYHGAGNPGGCKLPGFLNTSTGAATGGRDPDGTSWSTRPATIRPNHPWCRGYARGSEMKMLSQVYHLSQSPHDQHGDHMIWDEGWGKGERVTIDQYVRLNDPNTVDGVLRCWVDGEIALDRTDVEYRDTADSDIERIWWGSYFGGTWGSPREQYLELSDLQVWANDCPL